MKIGIGSYAFRWAVGTKDFTPSEPLTALTLLEKSAQLGAEVVQICDNVVLEDLPKSTLTALARRADELGIILEVGIKGSTSEHLRCNLDIAKQLGSRLLRVVLTDSGSKPSIDEIADVIKSLVPDLRAADITLAIENHFYLTPAELVGLVKTVDDPMVGVCLDPLNSISKLIGSKETISLLAPLAVSVHVKDAVVNRPNTGFCISGCPLGEGLVDLPEMLNLIRNAGRNPNLLIEGWMDQLDNEAATLAQEEDWIRRGIVYLRKLLS